MATTEQKIKTQVQAPVCHSGSKVTIVGVGQVGMACAFSIMTQVRIGSSSYSHFQNQFQPFRT